ncbi:bifunctional cobalt-precorrin-7 (C(5))-methyltransferase/cobalt-precorrin-6B (C(15))-methyltransferase [Elstera litoralis]|uniref:bifunctional cobalt-precorrin-7 (C(5))-methyltransferase/cobalt-precorrin-6B (C(15))-methyltransferase n=1 Tax=Elstera litoralis TaxID=552518 RepID=UPI002FC30C78
MHRRHTARSPVGADYSAPHPHARLLILSWDGSTPKSLADLLTQRGFGPSRFWIMEALGGPRERITAYRAATVPAAPADALNLIALDVIAEAGTRILPRSPGLPDAWFQHDGQITKREIRALTLSALAPTPGALLWDVGAGSGSVGIEWMLAAPNAIAIAVEPRTDRAATIAQNALSFGVSRPARNRR